VDGEPVGVRHFLWDTVVLHPGIWTFKAASGIDLCAEEMGLPIIGKEVGVQLVVDAAEAGWGLAETAGVWIVWTNHFERMGKIRRM